RFSRTSLSMHILPVVFALMFVVVIHRSADQQTVTMSENNVEPVNGTLSAQVVESHDNTGLSKIVAIAGPANASVVVLVCKTTAVLAKLARM
ncbi:MAG: hypothetical protein ABW174_06045, partial [Flavitalea sp.]